MPRTPRRNARSRRLDRGLGQTRRIPTARPALPTAEIPEFLGIFTRWREFPMPGPSHTLSQVAHSVTRMQPIAIPRFLDTTSFQVPDSTTTKVQTCTHVILDQGPRRRRPAHYFPEISVGQHARSAVASTAPSRSAGRRSAAKARRRPRPLPLRPCLQTRHMAGCGLGEPIELDELPSARRSLYPLNSVADATTAHTLEARRA